MSLYYSCPSGNQYKIDFLSENETVINCLLDNLNKIPDLKFITEDEFKADNLVTIDILDNNDKIIGELTFKDFGIDQAEDGYIIGL